MSNPDSLTKWNEAQDNLSSITDKNEIWRIENIWKEVLKNAEKNDKMKWYIERESMDELNNIKSQCLNVIKEKNVDDQEVIAQAVLSLLRINQILGNLKIINAADIDLRSNCLNQLKSMLWTNQVDFKSILWWEEWILVDEFCSKIIEWLKQTSKENNENKKIKENLDKYNKGDKSLIQEMKNFLKSYNEVGISVSDAFLKMRKDINRNVKTKEQFSNNVFNLIKACCPDLNISWVTLDDKFYSEDIKKFQQLVKENADAKKWKYLEAWKEMEWNMGKKDPIDWLLWRVTLNCLMKYVELWLQFDSANRENSWIAKFEKGTDELKATWDVLDRMPTTFAAIKKYWTLENHSWWQFFNFNDNPKESDFVKKEVNSEKKYVQIDWKKYYVEWAEDSDAQFKNVPKIIIQRDVEWNIVSKKKVTELCFWKFGKDENENSTFEWSKIIIDAEWKQIKSEIMTDTVIKNKKWKGERVGAKTWWWKEKRWADHNWNEIVIQNSKWRLDLFSENWKDTKEMNSDQINKLVEDTVARKAVINQIIDLYKDTMHKPSRIWRANLNKFIHACLINVYWNRFEWIWNKSAVDIWLRWKETLPFAKWMNLDPTEKLWKRCNWALWENENSTVMDRILYMLKRLNGDHPDKFGIYDDLKCKEDKLTNHEIDDLNKWSWYLDLRRFSDFSNDVLNKLRKFKWKLSLNWNKVDEKLVWSLNKLELKNLEISWNINEHILKFLEGFRWKVVLDDITEITLWEAESFAKIKWELNIWLTKIDKEVWKALSKIKAPLRLTNLNEISNETAITILENHEGILELSWIKNMDVNTAKAIVEHAKNKFQTIINLSELNLWDPQVISELKDCNNVILRANTIAWDNLDATKNELWQVLKNNSLQIWKKTASWRLIQVKF